MRLSETWKFTCRRDAASWSFILRRSIFETRRRAFFGTGWMEWIRIGLTRERVASRITTIFIRGRIDSESWRATVMEFGMSRQCRWDYIWRRIIGRHGGSEFLPGLASRWE